MHQRTHTSDTMAKNTTEAPTESASFQLAATLRGSRPGGAIRIAHYDVIDDVITRKL